MQDGERVIGYGFYEDVGENRASVGWALRKEYWGKGLSKVMSDKIFSEAKAAGITHIVATVARNNWRAIYSDLRAGFKVVDEDPDTESDKLLYIRKEL